MNLYQTCGDGVRHRATGRPGLQSMLEPVEGEGVPSHPDGEDGFYNCAALVWQQVDGGSIVTPHSAVVFHRNVTYTPRGTISHMSPRMVAYLARAHLVSMGTIPRGRVLPPAFYPDDAFRSTSTYNLRRRVKEWVANRGTDCGCKFHTGSAETHPGSGLLFGCAICTLCVGVIIDEPPSDWLSLNALAETYDPCFVDTVLTPLFETRMHPILIGSIIRQYMGNTEVASSTQYMIDAAHWSALSLCKHWTHGTVATREHLLEMSDPMTLLLHAPRFKLGRTSHLKRALEDPRLFYHGWTTQPSVTTSKLIRRLSPDFYTDDPDQSLLLAVRIPSLDLTVVLMSAMYKCWRTMLSPTCPSIKCCVTAPGYTIDMPHVIDAATDTDVSVATQTVVVVRAEYMTWSLFSDILALGLPILLHGNLDASGFGTGVFIGLFMAGNWSYPLLGVITHAGGIEHYNTEFYETDISFVAGDTPDLSLIRANQAIWKLDNTWASLLKEMIPFHSKIS